MKRSYETTDTRTNRLENCRLLLEDNVEEPAPSQRADGRLDAVALAADDLDPSRTALAFGICSWNSNG